MESLSCYDEKAMFVGVARVSVWNTRRLKKSGERREKQDKGILIIGNFVDDLFKRVQGAIESGFLLECTAIQ